jgi:hypothetical protein
MDGSSLTASPILQPGDIGEDRFNFEVVSDLPIDFSYILRHLMVWIGGLSDQFIERRTALKCPACILCHALHLCRVKVISIDRSRPL